MVVVHKSKCAFINYATRTSAEQAVEKSHNNLNIKGYDLKISWGRPRPTGPKSEIEAANAPQELVLPPLESIQIPEPPSQTATGVIYPSQGKYHSRILLFKNDFALLRIFNNIIIITLHFLSNRSNQGWLSPRKDRSKDQSLSQSFGPWSRI